MRSREAMARRYCIMRGEDPDAVFDGKPVWKDGLTDIDYVLLMLDSFGAHNPLERLFGGKTVEGQMTMDFDNGNIHRVKFGT